MTREEAEAATMLNNLPFWCEPPEEDGLSRREWLKLSFSFDPVTGEYTVVYPSVGVWLSDTNPRDLARGIRDFWASAYAEDHDDDDEQYDLIAFSKYDDRPDHYRLGL